MLFDERTSRLLLSAALAAASLVTGCARPEDADPAAAQALTLVRDVVIDDVRGDPRNPVADVVDVGSSNFVLGYYHPVDGLKYAYFNNRGDQQAGPFTAGGSGSTLRANTSKAFAWPNCDGNGRTGSVNYFAVHVDNKVYLDRHSRCNGQWQDLSWQEIASGGQPAVATRGTLSNGKALIVYQTGATLVGRFLTFTSFGNSLGPVFTIAGTAGQPDVIYNQHSGKFIVGFKTFSPVCQIRNVIITETGAAEGPWRFFGTCDNDVGGHHTSVAYNNLGDGSYVWWRENMSQQKFVFVHDAQGQLLTAVTPFATSQPNANPPTPQYGFTVPVTHTYSATTPYTFFLANVIGLSSAKTWQLVDQLDETGFFFATRGLISETVAISTESTGNMDVRRLRLTISDQP
jgi:hypothetical protein